jgi:hypothetical protein
MIDNYNHDFYDKDSRFSNEKGLCKRKELSDSGIYLSIEPCKKVCFLKLTNELKSDGIVSSFYFYDQANYFEIILILNECYHDIKFIFSTIDGWGLLIESARRQLLQKKVDISHIEHILTTINSSSELLAKYQFEKQLFDPVLNDYSLINLSDDSRSCVFPIFPELRALGIDSMILFGRRLICTTGKGIIIIEKEKEGYQSMYLPISGNTREYTQELRTIVIQLLVSNQFIYAIKERLDGAVRDSISRSIDFTSLKCGYE